jgi:toxin ParE1/3/4
MPRRLDLRPAARADLFAIYEYIATDNPRRALTFVEDIEVRCEALATHPQMGRARPDLVPGIRVLPLPPRVIVAYMVQPDRIEIVRIFYAGQDYEAILRDHE